MTRYIYRNRKLRCRIEPRYGLYIFRVQVKGWFVWSSKTVDFISTNPVLFMDSGETKNIAIAQSALLEKAEKMIEEYLQIEELSQQKRDVLSKI